MRPWKAAALVFGASGVVLMLEVLAGRLMAPYVGVSQETFTGIIGTVLAGIALGAAIGGSLADRHDPRTLIGPSLLIGGALTWASLPIVRILGPSVGSGAGAIVLLTAAAFLLPATVLSAVAPMVAKLQIGSLDESGSVVGRVSAAGTFGALAGTFLTGFVLVAALPSQWVVIVIGAVTIAAGLALTLRSPSRPQLSATAVALVLAAGLGAVLLPPPCDRETAYFCVRVEDDPARPTGRSLILDTTRHAYVDLDDPTHLEIRYVRLIAAVIDELPAGPLDAVHLGGGGLTVPGWLAAVRPGSSSTVLEIDPDLVDVARDDLGFDDDRTEVVIGDARLTMRDLPTDGVDVVVGDAFASTSVPWHLTTVEVVDEIDRLLRPGGVYVMNVIDGGPNRFARAQLATLAERFEHVAVIVPEGGVPEDRRVNQILIGSHEPIRTPSIGAGDGELVAGSAATAFIDGAAPLTDDFAPVDQLLMRG
ncbi:fused MFS/spermidine synthase [Dermatobacter hominis]|uniref:fused MFS/spermidine synthase n=1 Tax=Dermatobacter hominis TaxID=2884263 RepID=UPI001D126474|nr:fused MFS/spermidine synthase [Dermatobacter hominis]UDY35102.1 fused MFS/spermidine synthase [Dermatobacter hominis]